ncbi:hypothetical protein FRB93_012766 [Tulasnella sp. JGI-2019a]|nr:hypothetical protein FRB93_012766 [Tulasnella sp. JGI-2019a]
MSSMYHLERDGRAGDRAIASQSIKAGDLVLSSMALSTLLLPAEKGVRCDQCLGSPSSNVKLRRCSGCISYWYCGVECQNTAWKGHHKRICKRLPAYMSKHHDLLPKAISDAIMVAQLVAEHLTSETASTISPKSRTDGELSAEPSLDLSSPLAALLSLSPAQRSQLHPFVPPIPVSHDLLPSLVQHLFDTIENNHFVVTSPYLKTIANGVFPLASRSFNHACLPNACPSYRTENALVYMDVRALRDMKPGTEICLSYIDPALPHETRQKVLQHSYGFTCECERCLMEQKLIPFPSVPAQLAPVEMKLRDFVFPDLLTSGRLTIPLSTGLPLQNHNIDQFPRHFLPLLVHTYLPALSEAFSSVSHEGRHAEGITKGVTLLALYFLIYPRNYPLIGLHALEVAKVAWNSVVTSDLSPTAVADSCRTVTDLLVICRSTLQMSMRDMVKDSPSPYEEVMMLEKIVQKEGDN